MILVAGPCVIESRDMVLRHAEQIQQAVASLPLILYFKASFDKANRSSYTSFRGLGMERGLAILDEVKQRFGLPIVTDVHETAQCGPVAEVADVLQIPAFLCRQTDLIVAAALTGKTVNIKKGQFATPMQMREAATKAQQAGAVRTWLTERGSCFGRGELVVDFQQLVDCRAFAPVLFDATHSVQVAGTRETGGSSIYTPALLRAAFAVGVDGIFLETHEDPANAKSDRATQWPLAELKPLLEKSLLYARC